MNTASTRSGRPRKTTPPSGKRSAIRALTALGLLLAVIFSSVGLLTKFSDGSWVPKLALDLEGGTQLILTPKTVDGSAVTPDDINEAISIIRQRVDASGVAEAEITRQGQENIVVSLPGHPSDATLDLVRQSSLMRFRPVLQIGAPEPAPLGDTASATPSPDAAASPDATASPQPATTPAATYEQLADANGDGEISDQPASEPENNSDPAWITEKDQLDFLQLDCTDAENLRGGITSNPKAPIVACDKEGTGKFILGPADVEGTEIKSAQGQPRMEGQVLTGDWQVSLTFKSDGTDQFAESSKRLVTLPPPRNQFAMVLDGLVISAPRMQSVINDGQASITGNFTSESANALAKQLSFGSLPLNFEVQSEEQISATLGTEQLERGILAGLIGLALVMVYMLLVYKGLSLITMASLVVAAALTYGSIALLSATQGYRLSLPGVAGLIVAIGITADSFIVYFERVRDEVREGADLRSAVQRGWRRARRTILASDAVNLLAAAVLYFLAVGGVRGFAFTLGLTTIMDLLVVFWFTHPMLELLVRTRFFGEGHRFSGLAPEELGAAPTYRGRGRVDLDPRPQKKSGRAQRTSSDRPMTIAQRRAAARRAAEKEGDANAVKFAATGSAPEEDAQ